MILSCQDIDKAFGVQSVLEKISFTIEEKEKTAIVGVNGAGKTTLFKILTGEYSADGGNIAVSKDVRIGYLEQLNNMNGEHSIYDEMLTVFFHLIELENNMRRLEIEMSSTNDADMLEQLMNRYSHCSLEFEQGKGYEYKSRIRGVIKGLGFSDDEFEQPIVQLSGGQKTRVSLGKLLLTEPDLLLLDEPTNHLDIDSIQWLEDFLRNYPHSIIIISHDRYFLDRIVGKIIEIENRKATVYSGNYSAYTEKKVINREILLKHYADQQKEIKRHEEVITKLRSFNREKSIKRAESREKLLSKIERIDRPEHLPDKMRLNLELKRESGFDVLSLKDVCKSFDGVKLFENISFEIKKSEKVALIGANGIGKTTLFRIILKQLSYDSGKIKEGMNVRIQYYDQEHQNLDSSKSIFEEISDTYPRLTTLEIRNALAAFMFTGDEVYKSISLLSGGERGRIALAKVMLGKANFLILDEPTNHLDIFSKEILEQAIRDYAGTVLYISHDRYFINNTAEKIIELTPNRANVYIGNYDYYLEKKKEQTEKPQAIINEEASDAKNERAKKKMTLSEERKIRNTLQKTEQSIEQHEKKLKELDDLLMQPEISSDAVRAHEIFIEREKLEEELANFYQLWEEISAISEE